MRCRSGLLLWLLCANTGLCLRSVVPHTEAVDREVVFRAHGGLPQLEVLYTSYEEDACNFVRRWETVGHLGLEMERTHRQPNTSAPTRTAVLQIAALDSVLLFDLVPWREEGSLLLPDCLTSFMSDEKHTFFGIALFKKAAMLACEFDCVVKAVDLSIRAWPEVVLAEGGLLDIAKEFLGVTLALNPELDKYEWGTRPLTGTHLRYLADHAYLAWALADHFIKRHGPADKRWIRTEEELFRMGPKVVDPSAWAPMARSAFKVGTVEDASLGSLVSVPAHDGVPQLEVLHTSNASEAEEFMRAWEGVGYFGFDVKWDHSVDADHHHHMTSRAALLLLSAVDRVLIFDLVPRWKVAPGTLPPSLASFLSSETRGFFGMGLDVNAGKLACIYDCVIVHGVDYQRRSWEDLELGGGVAGLANKWLDTNVQPGKKAMKSDFRGGWLSRRQMEVLADHVYLTWALADHFIKNLGEVDPNWYMSGSEILTLGMKLVDQRAWSPQAWLALKALQEAAEAAKPEAPKRHLPRQASSRVPRQQSKRGLKLK